MLLIIIYVVVTLYVTKLYKINLTMLPIIFTRLTAMSKCDLWSNKSNAPL